MEKENFLKELEKEAKLININLDKTQLNKFFIYMQLLLEWNAKINLTAITEEKEIIQKHFIDSLTINKYINDNMSIIDVGTGAGFPGIPIKIVRDSIKVTLLDALNKRLIFLQDVIQKIELKDIQTIHFRAEEVGKNSIYREKYDIATSRAVAPLNTLVEYLLPLVKLNGKCICMKGNNVKEEIEASNKAIAILGGEIDRVEEFELPNSSIKRTIIVIKKIKNTPAKYPRKAGTPSKEPIV